VNHAEKINIILEYIEANLDSNITIDSLAGRVNLSRFHFHRVFKALTGENPISYVENRRLTRACYELSNTEKRIIDIAFDYGFQSHESFIRAFKKKYSMTPSQFRKKRLNISNNGIVKIGALDLKLSNGIARPNPAIVAKPAFRAAGIIYSGRDTAAVSRLWQQFWKLVDTKLIDIKGRQLLGVCMHDIDMRNNEVFDYYAGFELDSSIEVPSGFEIIEIPENTYAGFTHRGAADKIQRTYDQIYNAWLPFTDRLPTMDLDIIFLDSNFSNSENSEVDIFIPINR